MDILTASDSKRIGHYKTTLNALTDTLVTKQQDELLISSAF